MKAIVVYDSVYGNTKAVAEAIGKALGTQDDVTTARVGEMAPEQLREVELLIVGSPTQKFSPLGSITRFLKRLPENGLQGVKVAAFDTRVSQEKLAEIRILAFLVRMFGYAAKPIADRLQKKGGTLAVPPEGFCVDDSEGPLLDGELERAAEWAKRVVEA